MFHGHVPVVSQRGVVGFLYIKTPAALCVGYTQRIAAGEVAAVLPTKTLSKGLGLVIYRSVVDGPTRFAYAVRLAASFRYTYLT